MRILDKYLSELIHAQFENRVASDLPDGISVEDIIQIAIRNQMRHLLLGALVRVRNVSEEDKLKIRNIILLSIYQTAIQVQELKELEIAFEREGIINQPMKGSIIKYLYPSPEMREMSDIDILIEQSNMPRAQKIFESRGYTLSQSIKHHDIYSKPPFLTLEAHRAMYDKSVDSNQHSYFENFSRTRLKEGCKYTYVFGIEDFYIYMMAHMAKHFYQMGCGIRHLVDIYIYLKRYGNTMNREYVDAEFKKCGILTFVKAMEKLTFIWLGNEQEETLYDQIFEYMLDSGIYGKDENGIWNKFADEKISKHDTSHIHLLFWYWFPPLQYMSEYYSYLDEKPWLLPWAWIVRGVSGVVYGKGSYKRKMIQHIDKEHIRIMKDIYQELDLKFRT